MLPFFEDHYGNPSSGHWASTGAKAALESARGQVATVLGSHRDEIIFSYVRSGSGIYTRKKSEHSRALPNFRRSLRDVSVRTLLGRPENNLEGACIKRERGRESEGQ